MLQHVVLLGIFWRTRFLYIGIFLNFRLNGIGMTYLQTRLHPSLLPQDPSWPIVCSEPDQNTRQPSDPLTYVFTAWPWPSYVPTMVATRISTRDFSSCGYLVVWLSRRVVCVGIVAALVCAKDRVRIYLVVWISRRVDSSGTRVGRWL